MSSWFEAWSNQPAQLHKPGKVFKIWHVTSFDIVLSTVPCHLMCLKHKALLFFIWIISRNFLYSNIVTALILSFKPLSVAYILVCKSCWLNHLCS